MVVVVKHHRHHRHPTAETKTAGTRRKLLTELERHLQDLQVFNGQMSTITGLFLCIFIYDNIL